MKNKIENRFAVIVGIFIVLYIGADRCDKGIKENRVDTPKYERSSIDRLSTCPKCGSSYNEDTWGKMCPSCWEKGKGLQSNGHDVIK